MKICGFAGWLLTRADGMMRASPPPMLCRKTVGMLDREVTARFDPYLADAFSALRGLELALSGRLQGWISAHPDGRA